jgi:hypothetical protein
MGVLAGQTLFGQKCDDKHRGEVVVDLNGGKLDGVLMTEKVGACGHNLAGANHIIFIGSLYSQDYESQAIGISLYYYLASSLTFKVVYVDLDNNSSPKLTSLGTPTFSAIKWRSQSKNGEQ